MALTALLVLAPAGQALTLLAHEPGPPTEIALRVDEGPLVAQAVGNVTLDGDRIPASRTPIDAELGPWRGFANVTRLDATGPGTLLLADDASGLLVPLPPPPTEDEGEPASTPAGSEEDGETSSTESTETAEATETASEEPSSPRAPSASPPSNRPSEEASAPGRDDPDEAWGGLGSPIGVALAALAAGAFVVERWLDREGSQM